MSDRDNGPRSRAERLEQQHSKEEAPLYRRTEIPPPPKVQSPSRPGSRMRDVQVYEKHKPAHLFYIGKQIYRTQLFITGYLGNGRYGLECKSCGSKGQVVSEQQIAEYRVKCVSALCSRRNNEMEEQ